MKRYWFLFIGVLVALTAGCVEVDDELLPGLSDKVAFEGADVGAGETVAANVELMDGIPEEAPDGVFDNATPYHDPTENKLTIYGGAPYLELYDTDDNSKFRFYNNDGFEMLAGSGTIFTESITYHDAKWIINPDNNAFVIDVSDGVGVWTDTPAVSFHVEDLNTGAKLDTTYGNAVIEGQEGRLQLASDGLGTNASTLILSNNYSASQTRNWAINHRGNSYGNELLFRYGTTSSDGDQVGGLTTKFELETDGDAVVYYRALPDTHFGADLGYSGRAWNKVYADIYYNEGPDAWEGFDLWEWHLENEPKSKMPGMKDYKKTTGVTEIDPSSLPSRMTAIDSLRHDKEQLLAEIENAGDSDLDTKNVLLSRLEDLPDPDQMASHEFGVSIDSMSSANFIVINQLVKRLEMLQAENDMLREAFCLEVPGAEMCQ